MKMQFAKALTVFCGLVLVLVMCGWLISKLKPTPHVPVRPHGVPSSAIWAGGFDGGAFIDCVASSSGEPNPCTVYHDSTGDVWMGGKFVIEGQGRGASADELKYRYASGLKIFLKDALALVSLPPERPPSVPKTAQLAVNGVYVDCQPSGEGKFRCSVFLAAQGRRIISGIYKCEAGYTCTVPNDPNTVYQPYAVYISDINLANGSYLKLVQ